MPEKRSTKIMDPSRTRNYHICGIIHNIYKDNVFKNKKEINFVSIDDLYFIKDTAKFGHCMDIIDAVVNHIIFQAQRNS